MAGRLIWYPRYPGDYGRKTAHLSLAEHGAYALLMDYAYSNGGKIPASAVQVHRICRAFASDEQEACMAVLQEFFELREDGWHNARVEEEMLRRGEISEKRAKAAQKRHANAGANGDAIADANAHTVTVTVTSIDDDDASAREDMTFRERILTAMKRDTVSGIDANGRVAGTRADMAEAERWLALPGLTEDLVIEEITRIVAKQGPPTSFRYFTKAMQALSGELSAAPLAPTAPRPKLPSPQSDQDRKLAFYQRVIRANSG